MKFSVLVPVYNVESYIEECVDSILNQDYQDYEVILVDDGSTDKSGAICDAYAQKYPEKIRTMHKTNQGLISARRAGIQEAKGEYCVFVDSDDFVKSELLSTLADEIEKDKETDIILYTFYYYKKEGEVIRRNVAECSGLWQKEQKKELYERFLFTADFTSICSKAIRTSILKEDNTPYDLYIGKNMGEDLLQSLYPLTVAKKIRFIDKALYYYRMNDSSVSRSFHPETIAKKNMLHVYQKIIEYIPIWGMDNNDVVSRIKARWFNDTMYTMSMYYEKAQKIEQKKQIVDFNWDSFLPEIKNGECALYENKKYRNLYEMIKRKKYISIQIYFWKKKIYKQIKESRRKRNENKHCTSGI